MLYFCVSLYVLPTLECLGVRWGVPSPLAYPVLHSGKGVGDSSMEVAIGDACSQLFPLCLAYLLVLLWRLLLLLYLFTLRNDDTL